MIELDGATAVDAAFSMHGFATAFCAACFGVIIRTRCFYGRGLYGYIDDHDLSEDSALGFQDCRLVICVWVSAFISTNRDTGLSIVHSTVYTIFMKQYQGAQSNRASILFRAALQR